MNRSPLRPAIPLASLLLAACASAPTQFYTLVKPAAAPVSAVKDLRIEVLPVSVPQQVDVPQIVIRQSDTELALVESQQWIAPLGQEIRAALAAELTARLGAQDVSGAARASGSSYRIKLDVRRFESSPGRGVLIESLWSVRTNPHDRDPVACSSRVEQTAPRGYPALVEAHQRALQQIAAQIAGAIQSARTSGAAVRCPG